MLICLEFNNNNLSCPIGTTGRKKVNMKESEAIEELKYDFNELCKAIPCDTSLGCSFENAYGMAIQALAKQIPKKPIYEGDGYAPDGTFVFDEWICPCCETRYEVDYDDYDYCPNCGQKIDWSDKK